MLKNIVKNKWQYEINKVKDGYGFEITIYRNEYKYKIQAGFCGIAGAEQYARDLFLSEEFGIESNH